jgi:hypothetical protein
VTDWLSGREILNLLVDGAGIVRDARSYDNERVPETMRWPAIVGRPLLEAVPPAQRAGIAHVIDEVRATHAPQGWEFESVIKTDEHRILYAHPASRHGWIALKILNVPAVNAADDDGEQNGATGTCLVGSILVADQIARHVTAWLF